MGEIQCGEIFSEIKKKAQFIVKRDLFFLVLPMEICGLDSVCIV